MAAQYRRYVEDGGLDLHEAPTWLRQVGKFIRRYRSYQDAARARERREEKRREGIREHIQNL